MDYDKIILDLLNRIVTLEDKVAKLEKFKGGISANNLEMPNGSKKYRFLSDYLYQSNLSRVKLSYSEIEDILKFKLPDSAATHRAFWANTTSHSIALSWLTVNYSVVEANLEEKYIIFERKRDFEKMTIDEQMRTVVTEIVSEYGVHYRISLKELYELLGARFQTNSGSIIPSDYCYDRVNKGIEFDKKPRLFKFLGDGMYECLGENYLFTGEIKNASDETVVGYWDNGNLCKNSKWDLLGLK
ncbi:MAG: hypothetical protein J6Q89_03145 [Clostridia bacterium]|nr:hypothetical protein [Clostridia bacterium]